MGGEQTETAPATTDSPAAVANEIIDAMNVENELLWPTSEEGYSMSDGTAEFGIETKAGGSYVISVRRAAE